MQHLESKSNQVLDQSLHVMKFGGTSVGGARPIERVANITEHYSREDQSLVLVVSAIRGITNSLVQVCRYVAEKDESQLDLSLEDILYKHLGIITDLNLSTPLRKSLDDTVSQLFFELHEEAHRSGPLNLERSDKILAYGERLNSGIVAAKLLTKGLRAEATDATSIIETDNNFGEASPNLEKTTIYAERVLRPMIAEKIIPVVTGFIGATKDGRTTTLGRGGSDYTASILGRVLNAGAVWIWTDVDGVYTSDPRYNPDAKLLLELSQFHANQMVQKGIQVLYPKTLLPLLDTQIELKIKNTFNPDAEGTRVVYK